MRMFPYEETKWTQVFPPQRYRHDTDLNLSAYVDDMKEMVISSPMPWCLRRWERKEVKNIWDFLCMIYSTLFLIAFLIRFVSVIITEAVSTYSTSYIFIWITWPAVWKLIIFRFTAQLLLFIQFNTNWITEALLFQVKLLWLDKFPNGKNNKFISHSWRALFLTGSTLI